MAPPKPISSGLSQEYQENGSDKTDNLSGTVEFEVISATPKVDDSGHNFNHFSKLLPGDLGEFGEIKLTGPYVTTVGHRLHLLGKLNITEGFLKLPADEEPIISFVSDNPDDVRDGRLSLTTADGIWYTTPIVGTYIYREEDNGQFYLNLAEGQLNELMNAPIPGDRQFEDFAFMLPSDLPLAREWQDNGFPRNVNLYSLLEFIGQWGDRGFPLKRHNNLDVSQPKDPLTTLRSLDAKIEIQVSGHGLSTPRIGPVAPITVNKSGELALDASINIDNPASRHDEYSFPIRKIPLIEPIMQELINRDLAFITVIDPGGNEQVFSMKDDWQKQLPWGSPRNCGNPALVENKQLWLSNLVNQGYMTRDGDFITPATDTDGRAIHRIRFWTYQKDIKAQLVASVQAKADHIRSIIIDGQKIELPLSLNLTAKLSASGLHSHRDPLTWQGQAELDGWVSVTGDPETPSLRFNGFQLPGIHLELDHKKWNGLSAENFTLGLMEGEAKTGGRVSGKLHAKSLRLIPPFRIWEQLGLGSVLPVLGASRLAFTLATDNKNGLNLDLKSKLTLAQDLPLSLPGMDLTVYSGLRAFFAPTLTATYIGSGHDLVFQGSIGGSASLDRSLATIEVDGIAGEATLDLNHARLGLAGNYVVDLAGQKLTLAATIKPEVKGGLSLDELGHGDFELKNNEFNLLAQHSPEETTLRLLDGQGAMEAHFTPALDSSLATYLQDVNLDLVYKNVNGGLRLGPSTPGTTGRTAGRIQANLDIRAHARLPKGEVLAKITAQPKLALSADRTVTANVPFQGEASGELADIDFKTTLSGTATARTEQFLDPSFSRNQGHRISIGDISATADVELPMGIHVKSRIAPGKAYKHYPPGVHLMLGEKTHKFGLRAKATLNLELAEIIVTLPLFGKKEKFRLSGQLLGSVQFTNVTPEQLTPSLRPLVGTLELTLHEVKLDRMNDDGTVTAVLVNSIFIKDDGVGNIELMGQLDLPSLGISGLRFGAQPIHLNPTLIKTKKWPGAGSDDIVPIGNLTSTSDKTSQEISCEVGDVYYDVLAFDGLDGLIPFYDKMGKSLGEFWLKLSGVKQGKPEVEFKGRIPLDQISFPLTSEDRSGTITLKNGQFEITEGNTTQVKSKLRLPDIDVNTTQKFEDGSRLVMTGKIKTNAVIPTTVNFAKRRISSRPTRDITLGGTITIEKLSAENKSVYKYKFQVDKETTLKSIKGSFDPDPRKPSAHLELDIPVVELTGKLLEQADIGMGIVLDKDSEITLPFTGLKGSVTISLVGLSETLKPQLALASTWVMPDLDGAKIELLGNPLKEFDVAGAVHVDGVTIRANGQKLDVRTSQGKPITLSTIQPTKDLSTVANLVVGEDEATTSNSLLEHSHSKLDKLKVALDLEKETFDLKLDKLTLLTYLIGRADIAKVKLPLDGVDSKLLLDALSLKIDTKNEIVTLTLNPGTPDSNLPVPSDLKSWLEMDMKQYGKFLLAQDHFLVLSEQAASLPGPLSIKGGGKLICDLSPLNRLFNFSELKQKLKVDFKRMLGEFNLVKAKNKLSDAFTDYTSSHEFDPIDKNILTEFMETNPEPAEAETAFALYLERLSFSDFTVFIGKSLPGLILSGLTKRREIPHPEINPQKIPSEDVIYHPDLDMIFFLDSNETDLIERIENAFGISSDEAKTSFNQGHISLKTILSYPFINKHLTEESLRDLVSAFFDDNNPTNAQFGKRGHRFFLALQDIREGITPKEGKTNEERGARLVNLHREWWTNPSLGRELALEDIVENERTEEQKTELAMIRNDPSSMKIRYVKPRTFLTTSKFIGDMDRDAEANGLNLVFTSYHPHSAKRVFQIVNDVANYDHWIPHTHDVEDLGQGIYHGVIEARGNDPISGPWHSRPSFNFQIKTQTDTYPQGSVQSFSYYLDPAEINSDIKTLSGRFMTVPLKNGKTILIQMHARDLKGNDSDFYKGLEESLDPMAVRGGPGKLTRQTQSQMMKYMNPREEPADVFRFHVARGVSRINDILVQDHKPDAVDYNDYAYRVDNLSYVPDGIEQTGNPPEFLFLIPQADDGASGFHFKVKPEDRSSIANIIVDCLGDSVALADATQWISTEESFDFDKLMAVPFIAQKFNKETVVNLFKTFLDYWPKTLGESFQSRGERLFLLLKDIRLESARWMATDSPKGVSFRTMKGRHHRWHVHHNENTKDAGDSTDTVVMSHFPKEVPLVKIHEALSHTENYQAMTARTDGSFGYSAIEIDNADTFPEHRIIKAQLVIKAAGQEIENFWYMLKIPRKEQKVGDVGICYWLLHPSALKGFQETIGTWMLIPLKNDQGTIAVQYALGNTASPSDSAPALQNAAFNGITNFMQATYLEAMEATGSNPGNVTYEYYDDLINTK